VIDQIRWLGHGSFLVGDSPIIYINPWRIVRSAFHADAILISSDQYDQCSVADIEKLRGDSTRVIGSYRIAETVTNTSVIRAWQSISVDRASIKAMPILQGEGQAKHEVPGTFGYIISMNFHDIYYTGHTRVTAQMQYLHPDVAIIPLDQRAGYGLEEAISLIDTLRPRWVIPCNWNAGDSNTSLIEVREFSKKVENFTEVVVPAIHS